MSGIAKESLDADTIAVIRQQCNDFAADPDSERWGDPRAIAVEAAENIPVLLDVIEDLHAQVASLQGARHGRPAPDAAKSA